MIKVFLFFCYCVSGKSILLSLAPFSLGQAIQINFENKRKHSDSANGGRESGEEQDSKRIKENKGFDFEKKSTKVDNKSIQSKKKKPYPCDVCHKSFTQSGDFLRHKRTHTGDKPYTCNVCQISFSRLGNLKTHKRRHTGEQPYACDVCDKGFTDRSNFNKHKRTACKKKPYACDVCEKRYTQMGSLNRHKKTHETKKDLSGEKMYECHECDKKFKEEILLEWHEKKHSTEKEFFCFNCNRYFVLGGVLAVHIEKHLDVIEAKEFHFLCLEAESGKGPCIEEFFSRIGVFFHRCIQHYFTKNMDENRAIEYLRKTISELLRELILHHFPYNNFKEESIKGFFEKNRTISKTFDTSKVNKQEKVSLLVQYETRGKAFNFEALFFENILNLLLEIRGNIKKQERGDSLPTFNKKESFSLKEYQDMLTDLTNEELRDREFALFVNILFDVFYEYPVPEKIMSVLNVHMNVMNHSA